MAKSSWLTVSPTSGRGNATIQNIGTSHTGRLDRQTSVTGRAIGIASSKSYTVTQKAKSEFITIGAASYSVVNTGGIVTVSGTSNSPKLTVSVGSGGTLGTLTVNGSQATNGQNITGDPGASAQYSWSIQIQVGENLTATQRRITVTVIGSSSSVTDTVQIVQAASVFEYEFSIAAGTATIPASGGNSAITAQLTTKRNGVEISTRAVTPTLSGSATGFSISGTTVTAANRGTTVGEARSITVTGSFVTSETGETLSDTVTISQAANSRVIVYGKPTITSFEVADIPASGGSVSSGDVEYSQSRHYYYDSGQTEQLSPLTTGGQVTFGDSVSVGSLGYNIKDRSIVGQLTCQVAMNGQTSVEGDASVYQAANTAHKSDKTQIAYVEYVEDGGERSGYLPVDPSGQLLLPANFRFIYFYIDLWVKFDSGFEDRWWLGSSIPEEVRIEIQNIFKWGPAPSFVLNGEVYPLDETASDTIDGVEYFYAAYVGDFNNTSDKLLRGEFLIEDVGETMPQNTTLFLTQSAGAKTYSEITVNLSYPQASAAGGTVNPILTYSQTWGWNGSTTGGGTITSGASVSYSGTNINTSTGAATVASKGTTVSGVTTATTATVTVSMNGKTAKKSVAVQQAANAQTQTGIRIEKHLIDGGIWVSPDNWDAVPAKDSLLAIAGYNLYSYTSGATSESEITSGITETTLHLDVYWAENHPGRNGSLHVKTRGTVVGEARTGEAYWVLNGFTSNTLSFTQVANIATYGDVIISGAASVDDIPAGGGSVSSMSGISASQTITYTSGIPRPGHVTISYSAAVEADSLGTTIKNRASVGTLTATATGEGSKSATKSLTVYQAGNYVTAIDLTGFAVSYSKSVSAGGGTVSPSVTGGSVKFTFTSGSTTTTTPSSTYGSLSSAVSYSGSAANGFSAPNSSSGSMTASDRATTEGAAQNSGTVTATKKVTWTPTSSYNSAGTKTDSMSDTDYATQEANVKTAGSITYGDWQVSVRANRYTTRSSPCPAGGGTCTISASASRTRTQNYSYTSGSTSTERLSNETGSPRLSISGTGASLSGTTVTWASRGTTTGAVRQATVSATMDSKSNRAIVYQQANSYEDEYNNPVINRPNAGHNFGAKGGTWASGVTVSQTGTRTYTSGSTSPLTGSASFTLSESASWLTTSGGSITASANTVASSRGALVTINATGSGEKTATSAISITQDAGAYLNVNPTSLSFEATGGTKTITIDTNESWTIS